MKNLTDVLAMEVAIDRVNSKLREMHDLYDKLPTLEDLKELLMVAASTHVSLEEIAEVYNSDRFPMIDDVRELASAAGDAASSLEDLTS